MNSPDILFEKLWTHYADVNPQAGAIHRALQERGESVVNDHVAFRTFDFPHTCIEVFARPFIECGYRFHHEDYQFKEKKLFARHLMHSDPHYPKVFISQLKHGQCSPRLQSCIEELAGQVPENFMQNYSFLTSGAVWKPVAFKKYQDLLRESEYAAWMAAFGFRVNHFTVSFNHLKTFKDLSEFNQFIESLGYPLNASGGKVKGTSQTLLEQSSTLAYPAKVSFADGVYDIPGCYYEFARRYPTPDGELFQGFVPVSADKLFESTNNPDLQM
ncbi:MAG: DUF1338 domain-containing protein [Candidatus Omnitrophica bacterium]|nr:DUF1338 domain-containing protein [Candidatus Omnitrophota bacterium]